MKGRQNPIRVATHQGIVQMVYMEMQDVEFVGAPCDLIQHHDVVGRHVSHRGIETQGHLRAGHQLGRCHRIAAREKRDLVPLVHEFLGQVRDDALHATVQSRRATLCKGSDLGDLHCAVPNVFLDRCFVELSV
jgi:hypothetical protein